MKPSLRAGVGSARLTFDGEPTIEFLDEPSRIDPATNPTRDIEGASLSLLLTQAGIA
jgi:hypothetical protein